MKTVKRFAIMQDDKFLTVTCNLKADTKEKALFHTMDSAVSAFKIIHEGDFTGWKVVEVEVPCSF